ncbi:MAG: hypothetical protein E3J81_01310 [Dehalococcoidia bacterium]|nr:MAG: hypothetical protein E3J81_01310 [Dehalococcoidia bacterium]
MKALRTIGILVLVAGLMLGSVGTVFAGGPPDDPPGKGPKFQKRGFSGNVTGVIDGNVTIDRGQGLTVTVRLTERAQYKIPRVMNKWGTLSQFKEQLEGDLAALEGRRVVALAGNSTGKWEALKLMLLPVPGLPPLHAHRTGNVTVFNPPSEDNANLGNITIVDRDNIPHTFVVDGNTTYRPKEFDELAETEPENLHGAVIDQFVTVVTTGDPKVEQPVAKAIVIHRRDT